MSESDLHYYTKMDLHERLSVHNLCSKSDTERIIGQVRPDVSLYIKKKPVAVELQCSTLTPSLITKRTVACSEQGLNVLWIVCNDSSKEFRNGQKYTPHAWEKLLHAMYFGRIYYYHEGLTVSAVHLGTYNTYVQQSDWFDSDGEERTAGGYFKKSKRYRTLNIGPKLNIVDDFRATKRDEWTGGKMIVPAARLWLDNKRKWW